MTEVLNYPSRMPWMTTLVTRSVPLKTKPLWMLWDTEGKHWECKKKTRLTEEKEPLLETAADRATWLDYLM